MNSHDECLWESIRFTCHLSSLVTLYYLLKRITFSRELEISLCFCKSECSFQIYWMPRYFHLKYFCCNYGNMVWSRFIVEKVKNLAFCLKLCHIHGLWCHNAHRKHIMRTCASNVRVSKALTQCTIQGHNFVFLLHTGVSQMTDIEQGNLLSNLWTTIF